MTNDEMITLTTQLVGSGNFSEDVISSYLEIAKEAVVGRLYPFSDEATFDDVPSRHHKRTCEIACYLVNKQGAEGEVSHSENGVSRTYASAGILASYFNGLVPYVGVIR